MKIGPEEVDVEEVPCPNCGGRGVFVMRDDNGVVYDFKICPRCQGARTILIKIKKDKSYDF
jgi:ribosomal protein S27AE